MIRIKLPDSGDSRTGASGLIQDSCYSSSNSTKSDWNSAGLSQH